MELRYFQIDDAQLEGFRNFHPSPRFLMTIILGIW